MKLLVTGGAGYIGSVVSHRLIDAGHRVVVIDDLSTGFIDNLHSAAELHQVPIHDVDRVLTPDARFDGVLHFAGKIEVAESVAHPDRYWYTNVQGTLALLAAVRAAGTPRLIFSSTGSMYRAREGEDKLTEDSLALPGNPYAASKLMIDMMLAGECAAFGLGATSLRYFNAAGAVGHLGERHNPESHLIPIVLQVAAGLRSSLMLFGDDYPTADGTCVRDYIHVQDLATAHLLALEATQPGRHEIYNLGNGSGYSNQQVIETARHVTGHAIPITPAPRRPGDAAITVASSEKAYRDLGWKPVTPALEQIITDAWQFCRLR